jgi:hypothetical protein
MNKLLVAVVATGLWGASVHGSTDGTEPAANLESTMKVELGRAVLTAEDLKTLLGLSARDPSSQGLRLKQDALSGDHFFKIQISSSERARLTAQLSRIELARAKLESKLKSETETEIKKLRSERLKIQSGRTTSDEAQDLVLAQKLYSSLISETNLNAQAGEKLAAFDSEHQISIAYLQDGNNRMVSTIEIGQAPVWSKIDGFSIAGR